MGYDQISSGIYIGNQAMSNGVVLKKGKASGKECGDCPDHIKYHHPAHASEKGKNLLEIKLQNPAEFSRYMKGLNVDLENKAKGGQEARGER